MTLDEMIQLTAGYINKTLTKTNGAYTGGKITPVVTLIVDGLNTAKNKIAKEKFELTATEEITLDSSLEFYVTALPYKLVKFKSINTTWEWTGTDVIQFPANSEGDVLKVLYSYMPEDFSITDLTADFPFPEGAVSPQILCYFAAYLYFKSRNNDRQDNWLELWNDGFDNIRQFRGERTKTVQYYLMADMQ